MTWITAYVATAVVFLAVDAVWLTVAMKSFYARQLGGLLREQPDLAVAGLFYLVYAGGIVFFAVAPALQAGSWRIALVYGGILGLLAYGTYDATNLATLKGWPVTVSVVDTLWGITLTAVSATAGYQLTRWIATAH